MNVRSLKMAASNDDTEILDLPVVTFEKAWAAYPRKIARKDAMKAWSKVNPREHPTILTAIEAQKRSDDWRKDGGKFIPYFSTWLNGERWTDEIEADLSMGVCHWNINGNRGPEPRCTAQATMEKNRVVYCKRHGEQI